MPSMNQAPFLAEAVHSVLSEPGPETELVVMDGGSDDGSQALLADLSAQFPGRLRWYSGPDRGAADAVNAAVRSARAPLVGWLNSDDLYAPGAIARACEHLLGHPEQVMVYGEGEHVDSVGRFIERYPTHGPSTPLSAWADGCHICQPTAFFRRDAFLELGGLDTSLRASFDYEFWLRLFKAFPARIGFIEAVQAKTRLHAATITTRLRERVALEGMQIIRRHIGPPPVHWLLTHITEMCAQHPFLPGDLSLTARCNAVLERAMAYLDADGLYQLRARIDADIRLRLSTDSVHVGLDEDGWARSALDVRILQREQPVIGVRLACRQATPGDEGRLSIRVLGPEGVVDECRVDGNGAFELGFKVQERRPGSRLVYRVQTEGGFMRSQFEPSTADRRQLAFKIEGCRVFM